MNYFHYIKNELYVEQIPVKKIAAQYGTPVYIYSRAMIEQNWQNFSKAFQDSNHQIFYAVKANSNLAILNLFAKQDSGFDIVSEGELERVLAAGGKPDKIVFSGVGKTAKEIQKALELGIYCFNVESKSELDHINYIAKKLNKIAPVSLRVNPDISANTHPYISTGLLESKFGIPINEALELYEYTKTLKNLKPVGIATHIGSQIKTLEPFVEALAKLLELAEALKKQNIVLQHIDIGGGLGVGYHDEAVPSIAEYAKAILKKFIANKNNFKLLLEPGRVLIADAGILITQIEYLKHQQTKNFAVVDAGMNDLLRPALYEAWHGIIPVTTRTDGETMIYDVVGPVCETADFLGKNRHLRVQEKDLLVICTAGAYGSVMSSNYNSRPRAAEVLVDKDKFYLIRKREEIQDLFMKELIAPL